MFGILRIMKRTIINDHDPKGGYSLGPGDLIDDSYGLDHESDHNEGLSDHHGDVHSLFST